MKKRITLFLAAFLLSLPLWVGVNFSQSKLESFFVDRMDVDFLKAQASQNQILEKVKDLSLKKRMAITAESAVSAEVSRKGVEILFSKDQEKKLPIASLTKLMTSLVVLDLKGSYDLSDVITISQKAVDRNGESNLERGDRMDVENLLHMVLIESSNDAAYALSEKIGEEGFVELMNLYAEDIKLEKTHFFNPTGLEPDDPEGSLNFSTAEDMVFLAEKILKEHPEIFEITRKNSYEVLKTGGLVHHFIPENTNQLLKEFPQMTGGKTGWTPKAKGCLLVVLERPHGAKLVNVVLGSEDRFSDMRKIIEEVNKISGE